MKSKQPNILFNIQEDPHELTDIAGSHPHAVRQLVEKLASATGKPEGGPGDALQGLV